jgi:signal transduction histidine kinase/DNA-binding response OmpR family regulator/HPt (histidine-containing phosphotransfer) domain-containing protein
VKLRSNITFKLLSYLLVAGVVPLLVLGFSALGIAKRVVVEQARSENARVVGSFASYLALYYDQIEDLSTNIAGNEVFGIALHGADHPSSSSSFDALNTRAQIGYTLNNYVRVKGLVSLDLFSVGGEHFHVGETLNISQTAPDLARTLLQETGPAQSASLWRGMGPNINSNSAHAQVSSVVRAIHYFSPVNGRTEQAGVLVISVTDEIMQEYLRRVPLAQGQKLMQIDGQGRVVLHSEGDKVGQQMSTAFMEIVRRQPPVREFTLDGEDVLMDVNTESVKGSLVMITPRHLVTSHVDQLTLTTSGLLALGFLVVIALTWHYARTVVAPIRAVSQGFARISHAPEAVHAALPKPGSRDEISQLVEGYNNHLLALKAQHEVTAQLKRARLVAEEASLAKGQFLANMSHEIRTPINAILGMLQLLLRTELDNQQQDYADKTEMAAKSLLGLINDILDVSKIDAGKMQLDPQPFSLERMLRSLSVILSANLGDRRIEVLFDVDPAVPDVLLGDVQRLQQIFINLGGNAIKFTLRGQVVIGLRLQQLDAHRARIEFSVQDSGIGISAEKQDMIFNGFSQAEASTTRKFGGTGLGLSISKRLVELMDSKIHLHSAVDEGSRFSFVLELPLVHPVPAELRPLLPMDPTLRRALLVDGNPVALRLMAEAARSWGWTAQSMGSGDEALEWVQAQLRPGTFPVDVVYLAWLMPGQDGWSTAKQLRELAAQCGGVQPTIVMLAANSRESLAQRTQAEQDLLNGFLVKPVTAAMLREAVLAPGATDFRRQKSQRASSLRRLQGMRLLVVEDNLTNQQVAEELLISEGALVSLAANGQLGVEAVAAALGPQQFHAVLMDLQMPVLDGYGATRAIRQQLKITDLPIIAMTANVMASDRDECLACGMNEHVGKPFDLGRLVGVLLRCTGFAGAEQVDLPAQEPAAPDVPVAAPEGLDLVAALSRMGGMSDLYVRAARDFAGELATAQSRFHAWLALDGVAAVRQAHSLKGLSATLGAITMAAAAARLEELLKTKAPQAELLAQVEHMVALAQETASQLQVAIASLTPEPLPQIPDTEQDIADDGEALRAALEAMVALLQASDLAALERFEALRPSLQALGKSQFGQLQACMNALDLPQALLLCQNAQFTLNAQYARRGAEVGNSAE